jgi:carbon monoxide dehydrogenase subunit G
LIGRVAVASCLLAAVSAGAAPLLPVTGREVAADVAVRDGFIHVKFGFRVRAPAAALWEVIKDFRRYPKLVDGLKRVKVKRARGAMLVTLEGALLSPYKIRVRARTSYKQGRGVVRWKVAERGAASSGEMRVEPDGKESIFSLATKVKKEIDMSDILVEIGLRAAVQAVGEAVRRAIEASR